MTPRLPEIWALDRELVLPRRMRRRGLADTAAWHGPAIGPIAANRRRTGAGPSYLLQEDFEVNHSGPPPGWSVAGDGTNMDWYDTSSPIVGVASAATKLNGTTVSGVKSFTGTDDVWVFFAWKPVVDGFGVFLRLQDSVGVDIMTVWMWGLTAFALQGNGHTEFPSFSHTNGVPEYAWLHQAKGSGLNSVTEFYASTTTTKPASPLISWSDGTSTAQAANLMIDNSNGGMRSEWDYLRVADFTIGSSPA